MSKLPKFRRVALSLTSCFFISLCSCGIERSLMDYQEGYTQVSIPAIGKREAASASFSSLLEESTSILKGGLIISFTGISRENNLPYSRSIFLQDELSGATLSLPNGVYAVHGLGFTKPNFGPAKCGIGYSSYGNPVISLEGQKEGVSLSLILDSESCGIVTNANSLDPRLPSGPVFSEPKYLDAENRFRPITIYSCNSISFNQVSSYDSNCISGQLGDSYTAAYQSVTNLNSYTLDQSDLQIVVPTPSPTPTPSYANVNSIATPSPTPILPTDTTVLASPSPTPTPTPSPTRAVDYLPKPILSVQVVFRLYEVSQNAVTFFPSTSSALATTLAAGNPDSTIVSSCIPFVKPATEASLLSCAYAATALPGTTGFKSSASLAIPAGGTSKSAILPISIRAFDNCTCLLTPYSTVYEFAPNLAAPSDRAKLIADPTGQRPIKLFLREFLPINLSQETLK